ncbi:MAG: DUF2779 domain-containing protein [Verrucomicrobia bacterium]|nr:DUF2779 domain-containing protein [Verrucomicrobiota bacterium]
MPSPYLTKTDFKNAFECTTKLYYRKNRYPTNLQDNDYMKFLSDSGFMVEFIAKAQFPGGLDLTQEVNPQSAFDRTKELLMADENVVLFEAAALAGKYYARIDILRREGNVLHLIEVKSSSIDGNEHASFLTDKGEIISKWKPYLLDVAYQQHVLSLAFPEFHVKPWLWVVNKGQTVRASETRGLFHIELSKTDPKARPEIRYSGNQQDLVGTQILAHCEVDHVTRLLMKEVRHRAGELAELLDENGCMTRPSASIPDLYKVCRKCEYRFPPSKEKIPHGYAECWGDLASANPHIMDLYSVTQIGTSTFDDPVPVLLSQRKASLLDLKEEQLGLSGKRLERRLIQWEHSADGGSEHLPEALRKELASFAKEPGYPFHFMDFEACDVVLPHHAGLRPYERVAFQWSCHTLDEHGELRHREWLNTQSAFPNFTFVRKLRECIGDTGTLFVWSDYEKTTLNMIFRQIESWIQTDQRQALQVSGFETVEELQELAAWLDHLLGPTVADGKRPNPPRIRDLYKLTTKHYFHPSMRGSMSIKAVLPAVWGQSEALSRHPWFKKYQKTESGESVMDPYKALPALPLGGEDEAEDDVVREGTGAIRVYQELIFLGGVDEPYRKNRETLLKQYCELDTAAMVMIWAHWTGHASKTSAQQTITAISESA